MSSSHSKSNANLEQVLNQLREVEKFEEHQALEDKYKESMKAHHDWKEKQKQLDPSSNRNLENFLRDRQYNPQQLYAGEFRFGKGWVSYANYDFTKAETITKVRDAKNEVERLEMKLQEFRLEIDVSGFTHKDMFNPIVNFIKKLIPLIEEQKKRLDKSLNKDLDSIESEEDDDSKIPESKKRLLKLSEIIDSLHTKLRVASEEPKYLTFFDAFSSCMQLENYKKELKKSGGVEILKFLKDSGVRDHMEVKLFIKSKQAEEKNEARDNKTVEEAIKTYIAQNEDKQTTKKELSFKGVFSNTFEPFKGLNKAIAYQALLKEAGSNPLRKNMILYALLMSAGARLGEGVSKALMGNIKKSGDNYGDSKEDKETRLEDAKHQLEMRIKNVLPPGVTFDSDIDGKIKTITKLINKSADEHAKKKLDGKETAALVATVVEQLPKYEASAPGLGGDSK